MERPARCRTGWPPCCSCDRRAQRRDAYADGEMGLWSRVLAAWRVLRLFSCGSVGRSGRGVGSPNPARMIADFGLPVAAGSRSDLRDRRGLGVEVPLSTAYTTPPIAPWRIRDCSCRSGSTRSRSSGTNSSRAGASSRSGCRSKGSRSPRRTRRVAAALATIRSRARSAGSIGESRLPPRCGLGRHHDRSDRRACELPRQSIAGRRAAVVGCGGSGRAIAWALRAGGASVTLVNRCQERGEHASRLLGLPFDRSRNSPSRALI